MPESPLVQKEVTGLTDLEALIAARAKGETETELTFMRRREREEQEFRESSHQLSSRYKAEKGALEAEYQRTRDGIHQKFERDTQAVQADYSQVKQKIDTQAKSERSRAKKSQEETRWQALAMYEAGRDGSVKTRKQDEETLAATRADFEAVQEAAGPVLARCRRLAPKQAPTSAESTASTAPSPEISSSSADAQATDPGETSKVVTLQEAVKRADEELLALEKLLLPSLLRIQNYIWPFLLLGLVLVVGLGMSIGWTMGGIIGVVATIGAAVGGYFGLASLARPKVARHYFPLRQSLDDAERLLAQTRDWVKTEFERRQKEIEQNREAEVKKADAILSAPGRRDRGPPAKRSARSRRHLSRATGESARATRSRPRRGRAAFSAPDQGTL